MLTTILIAVAVYIGAFLIFVSVLAYGALKWVRSSRLRADARAARRTTLHHQSRRGRVPVRAVGDCDE